LFLACALLFWGWRAELLAWAIPMAVILELSNVIAARWEFTEKELRNVWNLCMLLLVGEVVLLLSNQDLQWGQRSFKYFQWLPVPVYLIVLAQVFGNRTTIPLSVFSTILRRFPTLMIANKSINVTWYYYAICIVAGSATSKESLWFYPAVIALIAAGMLVWRSRRASLLAWISLIGIVAVMGYGTAQGLSIVQKNIEDNIIRWAASFFRRVDTYRESQTAIGQLGRIHLSRRIVWRLTPDASNPPPSLLREASFNHYSNQVWRAEGREYKQVTVDAQDKAVLMPGRSNLFGARISGSLFRGQGILPLPHGTAEIHDIVAVMKTNKLGGVRVEESPDFVDCRALYARDSSFDSPPNLSDSTNASGYNDLDIPANEKPVLDEIIASLNLQDKTESQKIRAIVQFFQANFGYTMNITKEHLDSTGVKTPLGQFLTTTRKGHCEYFATATVLLLRSAGIPARYAIGYGVQEKSGSVYLLRERHGHAWTLVYRKESRRWEELDTTPASWSAEEAQRATLYERVQDFFSNLRHGFNQWRYGKTSYVSYLRWLLIPLIAVLAWRIFFRKRRRHAANSTQGTFPIQELGRDSEFFLIEQALSDAGMGRLPNELSRRWLRRVQAPEPDKIETLLRLHQRLRFDPRGLGSNERQTLREETAAWLARFAAQKGKQRPAETLAP
jgi:hypothetical protein